jgi:ribonuclease J
MPSKFFGSSSDSDSEARLIPLGGVGRFGMNCMLVVCKGEGILLDCGSSFPDEKHLGIQYVVPDFETDLLKGIDLKGLVITHGHEDHIGAVPVFLRHFDCPVFARPFTASLIQHKCTEWDQEIDLRMVGEWPTRTSIGNQFFIRWIPITHSLVESSAVYVETPVARIFHTGDFRLEENPVYGDSLDRDVMDEIQKEGVDLMLSDSTNAGKKGRTESEIHLQKRFADLLKEKTGRVFICLFSSHVERIARFLKLAEQTHRQVFVAGRSLERFTSIAQEHGYLKQGKKLIRSLDEFEEVDRDQVLCLIGGSQGEYRSNLYQMALAEHQRIFAEKGDSVVFSARTIPGHELDRAQLVDHLYRRGVEVIEDRAFHVSGHAQSEECLELMRLLKPKYFIPVHGNYSFLCQHAELARSSGLFSGSDSGLNSGLGVHVIENGDHIHLKKGGLTVTEGEDPGYTLLDSAGCEISLEVVRERRKLAERGTAILSFTWSLYNNDFYDEPQLSFSGSEFLKDYDEELERFRDRLKGILKKEGYQREDDLISKACEDRIRRLLRSTFYPNSPKAPRLSIHMHLME